MVEELGQDNGRQRIVNVETGEIRWEQLSIIRIKRILSEMNKLLVMMNNVLLKDQIKYARENHILTARQ